MRRPSVEQLPARLAIAAREVATVLARAGHRAWLVGGAVRDLALGIEPRDADLASAARPEELQVLFPKTHAVGEAFGTVVVHFELEEGAVDLEVTTFRAESGYDDARHPTHIRFSRDLAEDALRRDFTCNALYLDPLSDELVDPTGGLSDLREGCLRSVGNAAERFREDGLRLLRLARLAAHYGLEIEPATEVGAREAQVALRGVSAERILAELRRMAEGANPSRAAELLLALGLWPLLPALGALDAPQRRIEALKQLERCSEPLFLATLLGPARAGELHSRTEALGALRPSRALQRQVGRTLELANTVQECLGALARSELRRSRWIRLVRSEEFADALTCWSAWNPGRFAAEREGLRQLAASASREELWPAPLITSAELERARLPRGPRWKTLLDAAEEAQLDGGFRNLADARAWLLERAGSENGRASGRREDAP